MDDLVFRCFARIGADAVSLAAVRFQQRMLLVVRVIHPVFAPAGKRGAVHGEPRALRQNKFTIVNDMGHCSRPPAQVRTLDKRSIAKVAPCRVSAVVNARLRSSAAVGMIDDRRGGHLLIDRVQEHGALALHRSHVSGQQMEGLTGAVNTAAFIAADAPAHELIARRCLRAAGDEHVRVIRVGIAIQLQIQLFVFLVTIERADARVVLQIERAGLLPPHPQGDVVVHDFGEVIAGIGLADLVPVFVVKHLVPARVAVHPLLMREGCEFRRLAEILGVVGLALAALPRILVIVRIVRIGIAVIVPVMLDKVPGTRIGLHIVASNRGVLLEGIAVFLPEPRGAGAGEYGIFPLHLIRGLRIVHIDMLIQFAIVGVDLDEEPLSRPTGVEGHICGGHARKEHIRLITRRNTVFLDCQGCLFFVGKVISGASGMEDRTGGAGPVGVPAVEDQNGGCGIERDVSGESGIVGNAFIVDHIFRLCHWIDKAQGEFIIAADRGRR